jgi:hypothetical protein
MVFEITKRPYEYAWSGNPVHYELYSELAESDPSAYFEVKVLFKHVPDADYEEIVTLPYAPVDGYAKIDLQDILHGLLEHELPQFDPDETKIWEAPKQTGQYYIHFRQITADSTDPSWDESEEEHPRFIVKGGIDYFKYRGNNYWVNYFTQEFLIKFLTWQVNGRKAWTDERIYLAFLNTYELGDNVLKTIATVYYTDGAETLIEIANGAAEKGVIYYFPAGVEQLGLQNLIPDKTIYKWNIQVLYQEGGGDYVPLSEKFFFEADGRNSYNKDYTLFYRGSLGGLDNLRMRGVIEHTLNYKGESTEEVTPPDYFNGHFVQPQTRTEENREIKIWNGNTSYVPKEEQDRLRDAKLKTEAWLVRGDKWIPVNILAGDWKQKDTESTVWSMPVQWTLAKDGDRFYTPDSIDLGDGVFNDNVCRAKITVSDLVIDINDPVPDTATVTIVIAETDPQDASTEFTYQVIGVHADPITEQYADTPLVLQLPMDADYVIELIPLCTGGVKGKKTSIGFNTNGIGGIGDPCEVRNFTSNEGNYTLKIAGVDIHTHFLGASGVDFFNHSDGGPQQYRVTLPFIPSSAKLITDGGTEHTGAIASSVVTWSNITTVGGFIIELY